MAVFFHNTIASPPQAGEAIYTYDPFGRRLWKDTGGTRTYYLYSDEGLVAEYDSTGAEIKSYAYLPNSQWSTNPLYQRVHGVYYWYQNDSLGTPQKILDTTGHVVWQGTYDAFGNVKVTTAEIENNLRFAGQYFDQETGLYYNLNRYYNPELGRYISTDPAQDGLNLYTYVFNNPNAFVDPRGLCALRIVGGLGQGLAGLSFFAAGPLGWIAGSFLILNGLDNYIAGLNGLFSGEYKNALLEQLLHDLIPNSFAANLVYMGSQFGGIWGAGKLGNMALQRLGNIPTPTGYRYVGPGEAAKIAKTGYVPNVDQYNQPKSVFYTPDKGLTSASQAKEMYNMPNTPTHRIGLDTNHVTNIYGGNGQGIEGIEMITNDRIPAINIQKLRR